MQQNLNFSVSLSLSLSFICVSLALRVALFWNINGIESCRYLRQKHCHPVCFSIYLSIYLGVNVLACLLHRLWKVYVINTYRSPANLQDLIFQHFLDNTFSFNLETNISASKTKTYYLSVSKKHSLQALINTDLDFLEACVSSSVALRCT